MGEPQRWRWDGSCIQLCTLQGGLGEGLDWGSQCSNRGLLALGTEVQQVVSSGGVGSGQVCPWWVLGVDLQLGAPQGQLPVHPRVCWKQCLGRQ